MRANPQTHAGITLPDEIWVLLDQLADAGVGGVDEGIGMGTFRIGSVNEFVNDGPYHDVREAVLRSLGAIADWPRVYAGRTARRMYEDYVR